MKRREFLQIVAAGGSVLSAAGLSSCSRPNARGGTAVAGEQARFALNAATIAQLQADMQSGKHTAQSIARM
jgi:hypothetical protein